VEDTALQTNGTVKRLPEVTGCWLRLHNVRYPLALLSVNGTDDALAAAVNEKLVPPANMASANAILDARNQNFIVCLTLLTLC
jgi:hypothetical protein